MNIVLLFHVLFLSRRQKKDYLYWSSRHFNTDCMKISLVSIYRFFPRFASQNIYLSWISWWEMLEERNTPVFHLPSYIPVEPYQIYCTLNTVNKFPWAETYGRRSHLWPFNEKWCPFIRHFCFSVLNNSLCKCAIDKPFT